MVHYRDKAMKFRSELGFQVLHKVLTCLDLGYRGLFWFPLDIQSLISLRRLLCLLQSEL